MSTRSEHSVHTQVIREGSRAVAIRRRYLRATVKAGPDKGRKLQSAAERLLVGTHEDSDLVLTDPTVSRQHCEVVLGPDGYVVRDLDSTNGVMYERARVRELSFEDEIQLRLGDTRIVLSPSAETVDLPVSAQARFGDLVGQSVVMRRLFELLEGLAASDVTVLIGGESGTGKELAAEGIHRASARRDGPFVIVDCGALVTGLVESELFGHERGAFTGADRARKGAFVAASGGTLFLDEIGELPLEQQARLLGAIERRRVTPVGSTTSVPFDVRIIAATHRDLRRDVNRGAFREDLFFRLAVGLVSMPPLREHPEDIPLYVDEILAGRAQLDSATINELKGRHWPGNVRELRNAVERVLIGCEPALPAADRDAPPTDTLPVAINPDVPYKTAKALLIDQFDGRYLPLLLERNQNNISQAARAAELDRVHLLRLLDRFGLRPSRG